MFEAGGRLLVCGGRDYKDGKALYRILDSLPAPGLVITGGARGADDLANRWAESRGYPRVIFPANWNGEGRGAGMRRNERMLEIGMPGLVVAFPGGRGTKGMVALALGEGVEAIDADLVEVLL